MKKLMMYVIFGLVFILSEVCFGAETPVTETPKIVNCLATMVPVARDNWVLNRMQTFYSKDSGTLSARLYHHNSAASKTVVLLDCMQSNGKIKNALRDLLNNNWVLSRDTKALLNNVLEDKPGEYYLGAMNVILTLSGCGDLKTIMLDRMEITGEPEELLEFKEVIVSVKDDEIVLVDERTDSSSGFGTCTIFDAVNRAELLKQLEIGVPFGIEFIHYNNQHYNCKVKGYHKNPGIWWKWGIIPYWKKEVEKIAFGKPTSTDVSHVEIRQLDNARAHFNYKMIKYLKSASMVAILAGIGYFLAIQR